GLSLMQQDSFDDAILLSRFCRVDKPLIGASAICINDVGHPVRGGRSIRLKTVLLKEFDFAARYGDVDDAHSDVGREVGSHRSSKIVGGEKAGRGTGQWGDGWIPIAFGSALLREIDRRQDLKPFVHRPFILFFDSWK